MARVLIFIELAIQGAGRGAGIAGHGTLSTVTLAPARRARCCGQPGNRRGEETSVSETVIKVAGMTCGHCVTAVQGEISKLPGVTGVEVDLGTGTVRITADPPPDPAALSAAVDEAGYELAG